MFLALREIRRAKARFGLLVAAVALLMFLILVQQALQSGLVRAFVGAIERQSAPVLVYSVDGQRTLQGSVVPPRLERAVRAVDGVAEAGRIGQGTFTAVVGDEAGRSDAALIGFDRPSLGGPDELSEGRMPRAPGEAVGSAGDFAVGDRVRLVTPGEGPDIRVVGLTEDAQIQVTPTLFVAWPDYVAATRAANPDATVVPPSAIGVRPAAGVTDEELTRRINAASPEADALTRARAAGEAPGVAEVRRSFDMILLLFALVVPLVTGLFFLIITFQKSRALTLLRAVGAPAGALVRALLVQVLIVIGGGSLIGVLLYAPLSQRSLGSVALSFDARAVAAWVALLLVLGLLSALVAARRVLAIDPVEATTGGGAR
ncbi:FtsX-like permease family protein [Miltoncostaea marina]|uniref:FtsX-like permease family protein n=1 Tax=Miltoncostaea marina TaxID=2843215 RepID=UPI001C3D28FF|nr:FtsX-like permease family protein [Miltoncostaea marina]